MIKKFTSALNIRFSDIDAMGIVYNAKYFVFFEESRIAMFKELIGEKWDWNRYGNIIARNEADYLKPLKYQDQAFIETFVQEIGEKSIIFTYNIFIKKGEEKIITTKGKTVLVCFDFMEKKTIPVPILWREKLSGQL